MEGFKTDELFHKEITLEYNNKDNKHNDLAHADIANCNGDPAKFVPITWKQSEEFLPTVVVGSMRNASKTGRCPVITGDLEKMVLLAPVS